MEPKLVLRLLLVVALISGTREATVQRPNLGPMEILDKLQDLFFGFSTPSTSDIRVRRDIAPNHDMEFHLPIGIQLGVKFGNQLNPWEGGEAFFKLDNSLKFVPFEYLNQIDAKLIFNVTEEQEIEIILSVSVNSKFYGKIYVQTKKIENHQSNPILQQWKTIVKIENNFKDKTRFVPSILNAEIYQNMELIRFVHSRVPKSGSMQIDTDTGSLLWVDYKAEITGPKPLDYSIKLQSKLKEYKQLGNVVMELDFQRQKFKGNWSGSPFSGIWTPNTFDMERNGRPFLQFKFKHRKSKGVKGEYSYLGGVRRAKFRYKIKDQTVNIQIQEVTTGGFIKPIRIDITITTSLHDKGLLIESRRDNTLLWSYSVDNLKLVDNQDKFEINVETRLEITVDSEFYKTRNRGRPPWWLKTTRSTKLNVLVEHIHSLIPRVKATFTFENDVGGLFSVQVDSISQSLAVDLKIVQDSLQLSCKQNANVKDGRKINNILTYNAEEKVRFDDETEDENDENKFSLISKLDYLPQQHSSSGASLILSSKFGNKKRIEVKAEKGKQEVCNYLLDSQLVSHPVKTHLAFNDSLFFQQSDFLETNIPFHVKQGVYRKAIRFNSQKSHFDIHLNKNYKHVVARGNVERDGKDALALHLNTEQDPLEFKLNFPGLENSLHTYGITLTHKQGQYVELKTEFPYFQGFRINNIHDGDGRQKREIIWNGKNLGIMEIKGEIRSELKSKIQLITKAVKNLFHKLLRTDSISKETIGWMLLWLDLSFELQVAAVKVFLSGSPGSTIIALLLPVEVLLTDML